MIRKLWTRMLDAIEARLLAREHSKARLHFEADIAALHETMRHEVRLADGKAREEIAGTLLKPRVAAAVTAALKNLASRYAHEVHNVAVVISEEHFAKAPMNVRYGHSPRNQYPIHIGRKPAIQISIGAFDALVELAKLEKDTDVAQD